jgi:hypothetical protein
MRLVSLLMFVGAPLLMSVTVSSVRAENGAASVRAVLIGADRVTPDLLAGWKAKGATAVVVPLDETTKERWAVLDGVAEKAGMRLWPWIEVARNRSMADAHPDWMASIGTHHDDWRRRFLNAPSAKQDAVVKVWPWVPIGYASAFDAHRERLTSLLRDLPGNWSGVFLNDLQAGPSSCGCGNDQCRWALDYGATETAKKTPGDAAAARMVAAIRQRHPRKAIIPVWVTECEPVDLPDAKNGTGLCGGVPCAKGDCWPRYVRQWNPLLEATDGPIAVAVWADVFRRAPESWIQSDIDLFLTPPRGGNRLPPERLVAVVQAWGKPANAVDALLDQVKRSAAGWVVALDPIDQSWEPRAFAVPADRR